jgi:proteic killer suppression protein
LRIVLHFSESAGIPCERDQVWNVIKSFKHKGLQRFYEKGNMSGVQTEHEKRLRMQLAALDTAQTLEDMNIPGFRLHPLKGDRKGLWAITVNKNWRLVFKFENGHVYEVNYEDYH